MRSSWCQGSPCFGRLLATVEEMVSDKAVSDSLLPLEEKSCSPNRGQGTPLRAPPRDLAHHTVGGVQDDGLAGRVPPQRAGRAPANNAPSKETRIAMVSDRRKRTAVPSRASRPGWRMYAGGALLKTVLLSQHNISIGFRAPKRETVPPQPYDSLTCRLAYRSIELSQQQQQQRQHHHGVGAPQRTARPFRPRSACAGLLTYCSARSLAAPSDFATAIWPTLSTSATTLQWTKWSSS